MNRPRTYIFPDLELSGDDPAIHGIVQIGAWATGETERDFRGWFATDSNPQIVGQNGKERTVAFDRKAMKVNGFTDERVAAAPTEFEAASKFNDFLVRKSADSELVFVGSEIGTDLLWVRRMFRANGIDPHHLVRKIELSTLGEVAFGEIMGLGKLAARIGLRYSDAHDALTDSYAGAVVFHTLRGIIENARKQVG